MEWQDVPHDFFSPFKTLLSWPFSFFLTGGEVFIMTEKRRGKWRAIDSLGGLTRAHWIHCLCLQVEQVKKWGVESGGSCRQASGTGMACVDAQCRYHVLLLLRWQSLFTPVWTHPMTNSCWKKFHTHRADPSHTQHQTCGMPAGIRLTWLGALSHLSLGINKEKYVVTARESMKQIRSLKITFATSVQYNISDIKYFILL